MTTPKTVQPRKSPKQQRSSERVAHILNVYKEMLDGDFTSITTNRIAEKAGIPVSSLYQYFPNKEAIACEVYCRWADEAIEVLNRCKQEARQDKNWQQFYNKPHTHFFSQTLAAKIVYQLAPVMASTPELKKVRRNYFEKMIAILCDILRALGSDWPEKPLTNIASIILELNTTMLHHMAKQSPTEAAESYRHWQEAAKALLNRCIATPYSHV